MRGGWEARGATHLSRTSEPPHPPPRQGPKCSLAPELQVTLEGNLGSLEVEGSGKEGLGGGGDSPGGFRARVGVSLGELGACVPQRHGDPRAEPSGGC